MNKQDSKAKMRTWWGCFFFVCVL